MSMKSAIASLSFLLTTVVSAQTTGTPGNDKPQLIGDIGLALYHTPPVTRAIGNANALLPYTFADYGAFFARVDTFGVKLFPLGGGHLELSARASFEGYKPAGQAVIHDRSTPLPVGLGTVQETPYGAFFVYGFYDVNSGGTLLDAMFASEFKLAGVKVYPQIGIERRSARYVQHLYGVSAQENVASGNSIPAYIADNSISPNVGFAFEYPLQNDYSLTLQVRKRWLDSAITDSPLVTSRSQLSGFVSLARSFK